MVSVGRMAGRGVEEGDEIGGHGSGFREFEHGKLFPLQPGHHGEALKRKEAIRNEAMPDFGCQMLQEMAILLLNELKDLPSKVTEPDWLEEVEEKDGKDGKNWPS